MSNLVAKNLEVELLKHEQAPCPVIHHFGPGVYIREVHLPAGIIAVGHEQRFEQMNVFLEGQILAIDEDGGKKELKAPMIYVGPPGRKAGYVQEYSVWLNIYSTNERDVEVLEQRFLNKSPYWEDREDQVIALGKQYRTEDREDFQKVIEELGYTEKQVRDRSEEESDQIELPFGTYKFKIGRSLIEGKGVIATAFIKKGEVIGPGMLGLKRTPIGRFCNHAKNPNARMVKYSENDIFLVAERDIFGCFGGEDGEEITVNYFDVVTKHRS